MDIFLADESVDYRIISALRHQGFKIYSIADISPGMNDSDVLSYCFENNCILISEDKDFGELTIRFKKPNHGLILLRLIGLDISSKKDLVIKVFLQSQSEFRNAYSVLNIKKLRIRKYLNIEKQ